MTEITQADRDAAEEIGGHIASYYEYNRRSDYEQAISLAARHREAAVAEALNALKISDPDMPGEFVGDIWFGHPEKRTLGTHRWDGTAWVELPSELDATLALLADARTQLTTLRAKLEEARELLGEWAQWLAACNEGDDCEYLNGSAWDDADAMGGRTGAFLSGRSMR